jgi:hypothetical protein
MEYHSVLTLPQAQRGHRQSVENWVIGNKPLVRSESACFLGSLVDEDYVALRADEPDTAGLEALLEIALKAFPSIAKYVRPLYCLQIFAVPN